MTNLSGCADTLSTDGPTFTELRERGEHFKGALNPLYFRLDGVSWRAWWHSPSRDEKGRYQRGGWVIEKKEPAA